MFIPVASTHALMYTYIQCTNMHAHMCSHTHPDLYAPRPGCILPAGMTPINLEHSYPQSITGEALLSPWPEGRRCEITQLKSSSGRAKFHINLFG